jgi:lysophospholipid acyltransferase (LPLAT)-like uncharacterized protein
MDHRLSGLIRIAILSCPDDNWSPRPRFHRKPHPCGYNGSVSSPVAEDYPADDPSFGDRSVRRDAGKRVNPSGEIGSDEDRPSASKAPAFSLRQRILLWLITWTNYLAIALIGPTLRYSISWEEPPSPPDAIYEKPLIYCFWHRAVFPSAWMWRNLQIAVMVSQSFDGEYIARIIRKFGFVAVRGSSTRGGASALLALRSRLDNGATVAFTIDGPRGPKYVAKPGPVLLSRASARPMAAFYIATDNAWVLNTWDQLVIPKPFSRALVRVSAKIQVPPDADDAQMAEFHRQLQAALDRVTSFAEANVGRVGSPEFPVLENR